MTVKEFVAGYLRVDKTDTYIKKHVKHNYVPYEEKVGHCQRIVNAGTHRFDATGKEVFSCNGPSQYMLYMLQLISLYTDIDVDFDHALDDFNALDEHMLIDALVGQMDEHEITMFNTVRKMVASDLVANERDLVSRIDQFADAIGLALQALLEAANNTEEQTE